MGDLGFIEELEWKSEKEEKQAIMERINERKRKAQMKHNLKENT